MTTTTQDKLKIGIGTKEAAKLEAKPVIVAGVKVEMKQDKTKKDIGEIVVFICKHPDKEEMLELDSIKFEKDQKVKVTGAWFNLDSDGQIAKQSALAIAMRFYNVKALEDFTGKVIQTAMDEKGYLAVKAL